MAGTPGARTPCSLLSLRIDTLGSIKFMAYAQARLRYAAVPVGSWPNIGLVRAVVGRRYT
jgi:hypothetical protein